MPLKRELNFIALLFAGVGAMVGSSWLFAPYYAVKLAGPAATIAWLIGAIQMMVIALCYAETSSAFPVPSGVIQYTQCAYGNVLSFIMGWICWLAFALVAPVEVQATLQYAAHYFPFLLTADKHVTWLGFAIAVVLLLAIVVLNLISIRILGVINKWIVWWKLCVPTVTVIALISVSFHWQNFSSHEGFMPFGWQGIFNAISVGGIIYAFMGFREIVELAGEADNPQKTIPLAIIFCIVICFVLYFLLQSSFITSLRPSDLLKGWEHLFVKGGVGPMVSLAMLLGMMWLVTVLYIDAIISPLGTGMVLNAGSARVLYAMGLAGYMPRIFSKLNRFGVPVLGIIINFILGLLFFIPFSGWQAMVGFLVTMTVMAYGVGTLCLLILRKQFPDHPRPFRLPCAAWFSFFAFFFCNAIVIWSGWTTVYKLVIAIVIGLVVMLFFLIPYNRRETHVPIMTEFLSGAWFLLYLLGMLLISLLSYYGHGLAYLNAPISILITFIWSLIIFSLALKTFLNDAASKPYKNLLLELLHHA